MKIYTKGGDKGKTGIHGGQRVDKDDIRIEANGCLDELNSMIGVVRAFLDENHRWQQLLFKIQTEMMSIMSQVATPNELRHKNPNQLEEQIVCYLETEIDHMSNAIGDNNSFFVLPGGTLVSSHLHMARTIARRAERRLWTLNKTDEVPEIILKYINRLSDLFFTMARIEMSEQGKIDEKWKTFLYKRKRTN